MRRVVIFLEDHEYKTLEELSMLCLRQPQLQAKTILLNAISDYISRKENHQKSEITSQHKQGEQ